MNNRDIEMFEAVKRQNEGNAALYAWASEKLEAISGNNRDFSVEQIQTGEDCSFYTEAEFLNKVYEYAKRENDQALQREVEVRLESLELEDFFETHETTIEDAENEITWTVTSTNQEGEKRCDPPCGNCICEN